MKKFAPALAVTTALGVVTAAQADTTLYGSAKVSVDWTGPRLQKSFNPVWNTFGIPTSSYWQVVDDDSSLGVKGSEELGADLSAIYQYEFGVDVTGGTNYFDGNHPRFVGLQGGFGTVKLGTQYTPYYNIIGGLMDNLESLKSFDYFLSDTFTQAENKGTFGFSTFNIPIAYHRGIGAKWRGTSLVYGTPELSGFSGEAMLVMNGNSGLSNTTKNITIWELNLKYSNGSWFAGAAYIKDQFSKDQEYGVGLGYSSEQWGVRGSWQQYNPNQTNRPFIDVSTSPFIPFMGTAKANVYAIQGNITFGNEYLYFTYARTNFSSSGSSNINDVEFGLWHHLSKRTKLWLEYYYTNAYSGHIVTVSGVDETGAPGPRVGSVTLSNYGNAVSVGMRHDF